MTSNDTICAPATAAGGAIAVIRLSGPQAITAAASVFRSRVPLTEAQPYTVCYGTITASGEQVVDQALATVFRAPHSYTGEDCVEFSVHGSAYIIRQALSLLCSKGCRMAEPGEFTRRAFLNGKLDLSQAEAVADLIAAESGGQHRIAMSQLRGGVSSRLMQLRDRLLTLTSLLELELDFSDHEDVEFADRSQLLQTAHEAEEHIAVLAASFRQGQAIRQGIPVAIAGKTNVGKSTLLNALLSDDRAIVSDIHGTTRDTIEETFVIRDLQFRLIDTAGLRSTDDVVERMGIERTMKRIQEAAIIIHVADTPSDLSCEQPFPGITPSASQHILRVLNKIDLHPTLCLPPSPDGNEVMPISARGGDGIPALTERLYAIGQQLTTSSSDIIIANERHHAALVNASEALHRAIEAMTAGLSGDLVAEDLRSCISHCNTILGTSITSQDTLNSIFSRFCIGK